MNRRQLILFWVITVLTFSCKPNICDIKSKRWIKESPVALDEFLIVKNEILSDTAFINAFFGHDDFIFIGGLIDTTKFSDFALPHLKEWFRKGNVWISFKKKDTSACYKLCENGTHTAMGIIRFGNKPQIRDSRIIISDTLKLKDNWYAEVIKCNGCNE